MAEEMQSESPQEQVWQDLMGLVNQLPLEMRERYRQALGKFMHDMKHTLGLITTAQALARRTTGDTPDLEKTLEMLEIIRTSSMQMDEYLNTIVDDLCNRIEIKDH